MEMSLAVIKILLTFSMFLVGLVPGVLPVLVPLWCLKDKHQSDTSSADEPKSKQHHHMKLSKNGEKIVSTLACFGAGVFLGTFFYGMLGEVRSAWEEWFEAAGIHSSYCWAEVFATIGFLLVMFVEQITVFLHSVRRQRQLQQKRRRNSSIGTAEQNNNNVKQHRGKQNGKTTNQVVENEEDAAEEEEAPATTNLKTVIRSIILLMALSLHAFFEGMAIGLPDDQRKTLTLFVSICVHDLVEAFCFGINISQSAGLSTALKIVFVVLYACMAPAGIAIGLVISHAPATLTRYATIAILQGIASGTFLYVIFIEILPKQLLGDDHHAEHVGGEHHDHDNIFLEDMQNSVNGHKETSGLVAKHDDGRNHHHDANRRRSSHLSTASMLPSAIQRAEKLIKCTVFAAGIAVMGVVTFLLPE